MKGPRVVAGELKERVRLERRRTTDDGYGNLRGTWQTLVCGQPARIVPAKGNEITRADRLAGISNFDIHLRKSKTAPQLSSGDRLVNERTQQIYDIRWVGNLDEKNRWLTLTCQSGDTDGG